MKRYITSIRGDGGNIRPAVALHARASGAHPRDITRCILNAIIQNSLSYLHPERSGDSRTPLQHHTAAGARKKLLPVKGCGGHDPVPLALKLCYLLLHHRSLRITACPVHRLNRKLLNTS